MVGVEGGEHLADGWDSHLPLVEHILSFSEKDAVCDGSVGVSVWIMIQADHISLGNKMEEDGGEESEEANDSTESSLHGKALDSKSCFQENLGHEEEARSACAVREQLYPPNSTAQAASVNKVPGFRVSCCGETIGR